MKLKIAIFIFWGSVIITMINFIFIESLFMEISSLKTVYEAEINKLRKEVKKKTVPHFFIESATVFSGSGEIVIEDNNK